MTENYDIEDSGAELPDESLTAISGGTAASDLDELSLEYSKIVGQFERGEISAERFSHLSKTYSEIRSSYTSSNGIGYGR